MALGTALYKSGVLTGAESENANKRAFDTQNGFLPFAIHVPGTNVYYRISDFQPSMMSVITGAAWAQAASGDETPEQAAKGAVVAFTNTLADNSNLSNIGDLFGNYDGLGGGLWDAALGLPQSMVPSLSNAVAKSTDTTVRNPYDATDPPKPENQIMAKILDYRRNCPPPMIHGATRSSATTPRLNSFLTLRLLRTRLPAAVTKKFSACMRLPVTSEYTRPASRTAPMWTA